MPPFGNRQRCIALNRQLMSAASPSDLLSVVLQSTAEFNLVNSTTALSRLAKCARSPASADLSQALGALSRHVQALLSDHDTEYQPRHLSTALWALGKLAQTCGCGADKSLIEAIVATALPVARADGFRAMEISSSLWGLARLGHSSSELASALGDCAAARLREFNSQGVSMTCWALATLGEAHAALFTAAACSSLGRFRAQEVSNTMWAFAKITPLLKRRDPAAAVRVASRALSSAAAELPTVLSGQRGGNGCGQRGELEPQHLANLAWAVAQLMEVEVGVSQPADREGLRCPTDEEAASMAPRGRNGLCVLDFAALFVPPVRRRAMACKPLELSMLAWSIATCAVGEAGAAAVAPAMDAVRDAALALLRRQIECKDGLPQDFGRKEALSPRELTTLVWAFARLRLPATALCESALRVALSGAEVSVNGQRGLEAFSWPDLSLFVWACARIELARHESGSLPAPLLHSLGSAIKVRLREARRAARAERRKHRCVGDVGAAGAPTTLRTRDVATLLWSLAALGFRAEEGGGLAQMKLGSAAVRLALPLVADFSPRDIANAAWGLATMGFTSTATATVDGPAHSSDAGDAVSPAAVTEKKKKKKGVPELLVALAKAGGERLSDFSAQESSQFLWACDRAGVSSEPTLAAAANAQRLRTFSFPALVAGSDSSLEDGSRNGDVTIAWKTAERGLAHTGLVAWDAAYVLAEWMTRHCRPRDVPALKPLLHRGGVREGDELKQWRSWGAGSEAAPTLCVELGAGVGLLSIVAARLGVGEVVATDGDAAAVALTAANVARQPKPTPAVRAVELRWGASDVRTALGLDGRAATYVLATGVVYGEASDGWQGLVDSMVQLSDSNTLLLLAHGQGASPGLHCSEGAFFERASRYFDHVALPPHAIHPNYRRSGCIIHALRMKRDSSVPKAITEGRRAGATGERKRRVASAESDEPRPSKKKKKKKGSKKKSKKGKYS